MDAWKLHDSLLVQRPMLGNYMSDCLSSARAAKNLEALSSCTIEQFLFFSRLSQHEVLIKQFSQWHTQDCAFFILFRASDFQLLSVSDRELIFPQVAV
jgi:hypothetical protein